MAVVVGYQGLPVSWAASSGISNASIFALHAFDSVEVEVSSSTVETTRFQAQGGTTPAPGVYEGLNGLRSWRGTMRGMNAVAVPGHIGLVAVTSDLAYTANAHSWSLDISCTDELDVTAFQPSGDWAAYKCGLVKINFTYSCWFDDGSTPTLVTMPNLYSAPVVPTLTMSSGNTLSFPANINRVSMGATVRGRTLVTFSGEGTGAITTGGTRTTPLTVSGSANIIPSGSTLQPFIASSFVWKPLDASVTDRTFTGDAFPTRISINCVTGDRTSTEISFRGTGPLTPA